MLLLDPRQRLSMDDALKHSWLYEDEVKTPLQIDTLSIRNNIMRTNGNSAFADSSFEQSLSQSTPATTPAATTPASMSNIRFLPLEDQCSQDLEALRIDTNVDGFNNSGERTRRGLSANDSANLGSIVGAFPSVPGSDIGIPYPDEVSFVDSNGSDQKQKKSAIFVGALGSAWSPAPIANGKTAQPVTGQDTIVPRNKRKSHPQSVPAAPSSASSSSLSSLSDEQDNQEDQDADEEKAEAMDVSIADKPAKTVAAKTKRGGVARRAETGIVANLRSRADVVETPAKKRKVAKTASPPPTAARRGRSAAKGLMPLFPDEEAEASTPRAARRKSVTTKTRGARR